MQLMRCEHRIFYDKIIVSYSTKRQLSKFGIINNKDTENELKPIDRTVVKKYILLC